MQPDVPLDSGSLARLANDQVLAPSQDSTKSTSAGREVSLDSAIRELVAEEIARQLAVLPAASPQPPSPYMTVPEAAEYLRCSRQRVDDLLSQGRLSRFKDGRRTLVSRVELRRYLGEER